MYLVFEIQIREFAAKLTTTVSMMDTSSVPEALQDREERSQVNQQIIATPREERLRRRRERERDRRRSETAEQKETRFVERPAFY